MDTKQKNSQLNFQLAELLGWTNLFMIGGSVMGCPPQGSPHSRDQAAVPNWAGDFSECMKLATHSHCYPQFADVMCYMNRNQVDADNAYRHLVIEMFTAKNQKEKDSNVSAIKNRFGSQSAN